MYLSLEAPSVHQHMASFYTLPDILKGQPGWVFFYKLEQKYFLGFNQFIE